MKKILIAVFLTMAALFPVELFAAGASIGANLWYAWTEPGFKDRFMGKSENANRDNNFEMTVPATFVYGALFSTQFTDRLSLGGVFSYGTGWEAKTDFISTQVTTDIHTHKAITKMERFEGDLTINYALNNIFKIFFGWKYFGERGEGNYQHTLVGNTTVFGRGDFKFIHESTGPGVGLTSIFNIAENLYLITTLSGIYQKSKTNIKSTGFSAKETNESDTQLGGNGLLNFAYVIPETSVTLSLGGRYQNLRTLNTDSENKFYGVLLSAIYAFNL